jgi:hypothetical protein
LKKPKTNPLKIKRLITGLDAEEDRAEAVLAIVSEAVPEKDKVEVAEEDSGTGKKLRKLC